MPFQLTIQIVMYLAAVGQIVPVALWAATGYAGRWLWLVAVPPAGAVLLVAGAAGLETARRIAGPRRRRGNVTDRA